MLEGILLSIVLAYIFGYITLRVIHWFIDWETDRKYQKERFPAQRLLQEHRRKMQSEHSPPPAVPPRGLGK